MLRNALRGPFLTFNTAIQLSVYQTNVCRLFNPFIYNAYGKISISHSSFKQGLEPIFVIGKNNFLEDSKKNFIKKSCDNVNITEYSNAFFGCCSFKNIGKAILSTSSSPYSVQIKRCQFISGTGDIQLVSLPNNEQLIIEDSFFLISEKSDITNTGTFIYSQQPSQSSKLLLSKIPSEYKLNEKSNFLTYFSISRSFFGFEGSVINDKPVRDTISSTALFHDIRDINMTGIKLQCEWGCCLGINTESMIRLTYSKFTHNKGDNISSNLIWIWNLPDQRYQKICNNIFFKNKVDSLFYVDRPIYIEDCIFSEDPNFSSYGYGSYSFKSTSITSSYDSLTFDLSQFDTGSCFFVDPTSTPTPPPTSSPPPTPVIPATPVSSQPTPVPTMTPTPERSPWPSPTPMPSSTPTATPPYIPIAGISAAVALFLSLIIFLIVFFCREYRHKSSEDTVDDNEINANLSGFDDKSYSSETDPLNLNTSSEDSFVL